MGYLFYKLYQFWKLLSFGLSGMEHRASSVLSVLLFVNAYTILKYTLGDIPPFLNSIHWFLYLLCIVLLSQVFINVLEIKKLEEKYQNEGIVSLITGSILVIMYVLLSCYFFIDALTIQRSS